MIGELNIGGVFIPPLLPLAIVAFALTLALRWLLRRLHLYRLVWHAGLFDTSLFLVVLWLLALGSIQLGLPGSVET